METGNNKGQNVKDLAEGEVFGYPVESGMGCFMDYETQKLLNALEQEMFEKKQMILKEFMQSFSMSIFMSKMVQYTNIHY